MAALDDDAVRTQAEHALWYRRVGEVVSVAVGDDPEIWSVRLLRWDGNGSRYVPTDTVVEAHSPFRREARTPYRRQVAALPGDRVQILGPLPDHESRLLETCRGRRYGVGYVLDDDPLKNY